MAHVRGKALRPRLAAERAMVHCMRLDESSGRMDAYLASIAGGDPTHVKIATDYCSRVLPRLTGHSDDEEEGVLELRL